LELSRVSVVDGSLQVVYDSFVKPRNEIIDYNTAWSGITPDILAEVTTRLEDVQQDILRFTDANTVIVGHSLENDLRALKVP